MTWALIILLSGVGSSIKLWVSLHSFSNTQLLYSDGPQNKSWTLDNVMSFTWWLMLRGKYVEWMKRFDMWSRHPLSLTLFNKPFVLCRPWELEGLLLKTNKIVVDNFIHFILNQERTSFVTIHRKNNIMKLNNVVCLSTWPCILFCKKQHVFEIYGHQIALN